MVRVVVFALFALAALPCAAQYPDRNVTFLANFPPGGLVDIVTRVVADGMKPKFPHGITVVNKPGAGGAVGVTDLIQAKPDGYTILLTPQSSLVIAPQMNPKLAYKTPDEYDPVINVVAYYPLLAVTADAPWKSIQDFVADAKANPGKMRVGTPGEGTASHLNLEEFIFRTGTKSSATTSRRWWHSRARLSRSSTASAYACSRSSRKSATRPFPTRRPRKKRAGTLRTACGTCWSCPRARLHPSSSRSTTPPKPSSTIPRSRRR